MRSSIPSFDVTPIGFLDDEECEDIDLCQVRYFISVGAEAALENKKSVVNT